MEDNHLEILKEIHINYYEPMMKNVPVTVSKYEVTLKNAKLDSEEFLRNLKKNLDKYVYLNRKSIKKSLREGFTIPEITSLNGDPILKITYFKETLKKIEIPKEGKLEKYKIGEVISNNKVNFVIVPNQQVVQIYRIGGDDSFVLKARHRLLTNIKTTLKNTWHEEIEYKFTRSTMYNILGKLEGATYIDIDPTDNEKFAKVIGAYPGGKKRKEYYVEDIKIRGYKILDAPKIREILEEEKIKVTEVIGKLRINPRQKITIWAKMPDKITFFLSPKIVGSDSEKDIINFAIETYDKLLSETLVPTSVQSSLIDSILSVKSHEEAS